MRNWKTYECHQEILEKRIGDRKGQYSIRINEIVHGKRSITVDTALRLSRYFGLSERYWLNLQARYDLETEKEKLKGRIEEEVKVFERKTA